MKTALTACSLICVLLFTYVALKPAEPEGAVNPFPAAVAARAVPEAPTVSKPVMPALEAQPKPGVPALGSISGVVLDTNGRPLAGARVGIYRDEIPRKEASDAFRHLDWIVATTDPKGAFTLRNLGAGTYVASVTPADSTGYANPYGERRISLEGGDDIRGLKWVFGEGDLVWGRITDPEGNPLSQAYVRVDKVTEPRLNVGATSQEDGFYIVEGLPPGDYYLSVMAARSEYINSPIYREVVPGTELNFVLERRPVVQGQVVRADTGQPVVGFGIFAGETPADLSLEAEGLESGLFQRVDDAEGRFEVGAVSPGDTTVWVKAPGFRTACKHITGLTSGETTENVVIGLSPSVPLKGLVTDKEGKSIGGAAVFLGYPKLWLSRGEMQPKNGRVETVSAEDGSFGLDEWPQELTRVSAFFPGYAPGTTVLNGDPVKARPLTIVLNKGGSLSGKVTLDGRALNRGEGTVSAMLSGANDTFGGVSAAVVGDGGRYRLEAITPGQIRIRCYLPYDFLPPGTDHWLEKVVDVADESRSELNFKFTSSSQAAIEGNIRCAKGALRGTLLTLSMECDDGQQECFMVGVDPNGHYRLDGLPAGTFHGRLQAQQMGGSPLDQEFVVETVAGQVTQGDLDVGS